MRGFVLFIALVTVLLVALPAKGEDPAPVGTGHGVFQAVCFFSHVLDDDPIVFPHGPGQSHKHSFFGGKHTNADSTNESSRADGSTCIRYNSLDDKGADHSSYWVPTLYVNDQPVEASEMSAYYSNGVRALNQIKPFPANLKIVAGDAKGLTPAEVNGQRVYYWSCGGAQVAAGDVTHAPTCSTRLDLKVRFPDCWDGTNEDSLNHKSHMSYSKQTVAGSPTRTCDSAHPVLVPMLELSLRYPTKGGPTTRLASGAINTAHADFMNGWDQTRQSQLVRDCLVQDEYCGGADAPVPGH